MSDPKDKPRLNEIGILPREYQNPATTRNADGVFDALEINQRTQDRIYSDQVADENSRDSSKIRGKEIHSG